MKFQNLALLLLVATATACGQKQYQDETRQEGYLVRRATISQLQKLSSLAGSRVKTLHSPTGLYKVTGLTETQIKEAVGPDVEVSENLVFESLLAEAAPPSFFDTCKPSPEQTAATIAPIAKLQQFEQISREGVALESRSGETAHWTITGPLGPTAQTYELVGAKALFYPSEPGGYVVSAISRNTDGACSVPTVARFAATLDMPLASGKTNVPDKRVVVAVLDTGVNYNHADLRANILTDGEAIVGKDFANSDDLPFDDNGHGTHVAGLVAGRATGVAPQALLMPVKVLDALGDGELGAIEAGIRFAVDHKARIIVLAFGSNHPKFKEGLRSALDYAMEQDVLVVVAAGNKAQDLDEKPYYPASLSYSNLISVAATNAQGDLASYSSYGRNSVDLAALGGDRENGLVSTAHWPVTANAYSTRSGTSMAAPKVAGAAAALLLRSPSELKASEIKQLLLSSATPTPQLKGRIKTASILNIEQLIKILN